VTGREHGTLRRVDRRRLHVGTGEILCVACVRNESLRLPHFLEHHRALGVDRFFVVDNASDDDTVEYLLAQRDVHVFLTRQRYSESRCGVTWLNWVLERHGIGHWVLSADADELLVYPGCEKVGLRRLSTYLEAREEEALSTFLLDMYSDRPIRETVYRRGMPFLATCPYFDSDSYRWDDPSRRGTCGPSRGGPRGRLFWTDKEGTSPPPFLGKIPFANWRPGLEYTASTHLLPGAVLAELTGALLHFKFFSDFVARVGIEAERGEHWENARQYAAYREVMERRPDLSAFYDRSLRYEGDGQLAALGMAFVPEDFRILAGLAEGEDGAAG